MQHGDGKQDVHKSSQGAEESTEEGLTGTWQTASSMINCFIGAGILTVPYAFRLAGYASGFALLLVAGLNWVSSILLGHALSKAARLRPDIPRAAWDLKELGGTLFGFWGRHAIAAALALEIWFALETFLILIGINVRMLTGLPKAGVIGVAGCLGTWSMSMKMSDIAWLSCISVWCMLGGLIALVVCGSLSSDAPGVDAHKHDFFRPQALPPSIAIFTYAFSGLPCLPNIRAGMRHTENYTRAVNMAFAFAVPYYLAVGLAGYYFFADATRESFTLNFVAYPSMPYRHTFLVFSVVSSGLFVLKLQAGFPLYAAPILQALGYGHVGTPLPKDIMVARVVFALVSAIFAIVARDALSNVAEIMGALLTMSTSVLFPVSAYAASRYAVKEPLEIWEAVGLGCIFSAGIALSFSDLTRWV